MVIEGVDVFNHVARIYEPDTSALLQPENEFEAMVLESVLKNECIDEHFVDTSTQFHHQDDPCFQSLLPVNSSIPDTHMPLQVSSTSGSQPMPSSSSSDSIASIDGFVTAMWPYLKQAGVNIGLDPKILLAQAALETGWGKSILKDVQGNSTYNIFNIKSTTELSKPSVDVQTTEYINHTAVKLTAAFKSYQSIGESVQDYLSLIQGSTRYQEALSHANSPNGYVQALQEAGYATDPNYAHKILSIYHGEVLQDALDRNGLV